MGNMAYSTQDNPLFLDTTNITSKPHCNIYYLFQFIPCNLEQIKEPVLVNRLVSELIKVFYVALSTGCEVVSSKLGSDRVNKKIN